MNKQKRLPIFPVFEIIQEKICASELNVTFHEYVHYHRIDLCRKRHLPIRNNTFYDKSSCKVCLQKKLL